MARNVVARVMQQPGPKVAQSAGNLIFLGVTGAREEPAFFQSGAKAMHGLFRQAKLVIDLRGRHRTIAFTQNL